MTDAEVICAWMEPRPVHHREHRPGIAWWVWKERPHFDCDWYPALAPGVVDPVRHLGMLHEVEARLTEGQWLAYHQALANEFSDDYSDDDRPHILTCMTHATAPQKIAALAAVLRAEVEHGE